MVIASTFTEEFGGCSFISRRTPEVYWLHLEPPFMRATFFTVLAALLALFMLRDLYAQTGQRRVALVMSNARYEVSPLINPVHDAEDMKAALERVGFTVTIGTDLSRRAMNDAISKFASGLRKGDVALFYY